MRKKKIKKNLQNKKLNAKTEFESKFLEKIENKI